MANPFIQARMRQMLDLPRIIGPGFMPTSRGGKTVRAVRRRVSDLGPRRVWAQGPFTPQKHVRARLARGLAALRPR